MEREHFPRPVSVLFADLFPPITIGWQRGAARYGETSAAARWGTVNCWLYYGAGDQPPPDPALEGVAARARAESWWRDEVRRWHDEERPRVVAANRALQQEDLAAMDEAALADHLARAFAHYGHVAPLHFEHAGNNVCNRVLVEEAAAAGFPDLSVGALAVGSSPASARPAVLIGRIAGALREVGEEADGLSSLDDYLDEYGWRLVESYDPSFPALNEQPAVVLRSIRACLSGQWRGGEGSLVAPAPPWEGNARLDELLADARALHAVRDDDDGTCFFWPMGLIRRAVLEAGRRLVSSGRLVAVTDLFEATSDEILGLVGGSSADPSSAELSERARRRSEAGEIVPPPAIGGEPAPWHRQDDGGDGADPRRLTGTAVGTGIGRGRARVHRSGDDVLSVIEPGDVLVAVTTTPAFNTVFPALAGVITELGGLHSHAALLSRELGLPAVLGVAGAMDIPDGAMVEVDGDAGVCTLL